jgi:hypothetical protein
LAINQADWNAVRSAVAASGGEVLYRRIVEPITETNEATGEETTREIVRYKAVPTDQSGKESFKRIEADVERIIQEVQSLQLAERELRNALEEPAGAETQRR